MRIKNSYLKLCLQFEIILLLTKKKKETLTSNDPTKICGKINQSTQQLWSFKGNL